MGFIFNVVPSAEEVQIVLTAALKVFPARGIYSLGQGVPDGEGGAEQHLVAF